VSELEKEYTLQLDGELGSGGSSQVYRAEHKVTGISRAVKRVRKSLNLQGEVDVMKRLQDCPHVVHVKDAFADDTYHYIVMELCFGLDLVDSLLEELHGRDAHPNVPHVAAVFREMVKAVAECHEKRVCHMDIKPENFVHVSAGDQADAVKILDFGLAVADVDTLRITRRTRLGCSRYLAPELFARGGADVALRPCDMYALGVSLYNLLTGRFPYAFTQTGRPMSWQPNLDIVPDPAARDLIGQLLSADAALRPNVKEVLQHKFLRAHEDVKVKPLLEPPVRSLFESSSRRNNNGVEARFLKAGDVLYYQGDPSPALYFVSEGSFKVLSCHGGHVLGTVGPGSVVGEVGALFHYPHHVTVVATEDSKVLELSCNIGQQVETPEERHAFRRLQELAAEKEVRYAMLDFLKSTELFQDANSDFINLLIKASSHRFFEEGSLLQTAEPGDDNKPPMLYIVQEGLLELQSPRSKHSVHIGPGELAGAMELIFEPELQPVSSGKLMAVKPTTALALSRSDFALILSNFVKERQAIASIAASQHSRLTADGSFGYERQHTHVHVKAPQNTRLDF
jgi:serine/threonine protein kinase